MEANHDPYGALRIGGYRRLLAGNILANVGAEMQAIAVGWEMYERTRSPAMLGFVGLAQFLPVLILSLVAGHAADRTSRKWLLITSQVGMTFISLLLAAHSELVGPIWLVFVLLFLAGCCRAFAMPARSSLLSQIVPLERLTNAVTWNSSGWHIANMAGPALGGLALAALGPPATCYRIAAVCTAICILLVMSLKPRPLNRPTETVSLTSLLAGLHFVWGRQLLLATITLDLFAVLLGGATALLPVFATDILDVGPTGLGWLRAAPAIGAFVSAFVVAHRPMRRAGITLLASVAGFGLAIVCFGLSRDAYLSFGLLALTGALDNVSVVVRGSLMQLLTPDAMRGRVAGVNSIFISSSNELGAFESGITAEWFGPVPAVVIGGVGTLLVVMGVALRWPRLVKLGPLSSISATTAPLEIDAKH